MDGKTTIALFDRQADALDSSVDELLVGANTRRPVGASFLLRAAGIVLAAQVPGLQVLLAQQDGNDLRHVHVEGDAGIVAMVADMQRHAACVVTPSEVRFPNGGVLRWTGLGREADVRRAVERRVDVLLVDNVDAVGENTYLRLRDHTLRSIGPIRRVVATCKKVGQAGWVDRHWNGMDVPGRGFLELSPADIDEDLIEVPHVPSYREFIESVHGGQWLWPPHVELVVDTVDRWVHGEWEHLAIFMPSQHGKTTSGPRNAIPYIHHLFPSDWCAIVSYGSDLANSRSADARENFVKSGGQLLPGRRKINEWYTRHGGGCWSAGTAAGQAGRSATWAFMDDGDQDWADAVNKTSQKKKRRWYGSVLRARETMFAAEQREQKLCITATRWDPEDLAGYALRLGHEAGESWAVLCLSALYDPLIIDAYQEMYPRFDIIQDFRERPNEPIWPDRRGPDRWERVRKIRGPRIFLTECQQNAKGVEQGGLFYAEWFNRLDRDPAFATARPNEGVYVEQCRAWDLAATEGGGDHTAGVKLGRLEDGRVVVRHSVKEQLSPSAVEQLIAAMMILDGPDVTVRIPIDPAAGGVASAESIVKYLRLVAAKVGMPEPPIVTERPRHVAHSTLSAKAARARDLQSFAEPADWKVGREPRMPGGLCYVADRWRPAVSDRVPRYDEVARDWPELASIAERGRAAGREWWTPFLGVFESFTGEDGREDDEIDATVDGFDQVRYHEGPYSFVIRPR